MKDKKDTLERIEIETKSETPYHTHLLTQYLALGGVKTALSDLSKPVILALIRNSLLAKLDSNYDELVDMLKLMLIELKVSEKRKGRKELLKGFAHKLEPRLQILGRKEYAVEKNVSESEE